MDIEYEIIDFHTHPFASNDTNMCSHTEYCNMSAENTKAYLSGMGISKICGSVIGRRCTPEEGETAWQELKRCNDEALELQNRYGGFYIPGVHIHPGFLRESCEEIERMSKRGVRLVGELVPNWYGWEDYSCKAFSELLDVCRQYNMVVSFHSRGEDEMDKMVREHPNVTFVAAHPGEYAAFMRHLERMKTSDNYYLDLSGTGLFRHGMLRHALDVFGSERFLFGSDYPTCNPAMFIGGVYFDSLIKEEEKQKIFSENAKRLLGIPDTSNVRALQMEV